MKKVFWTSIVWIILFGGFALYMKLFNPTLGQTVAKFIYSGEECPVLQCDTPACEPCECEGSGQQLECPEVEPAVCNCPAQTVTDSDVCTKVFDQLDKIEKKLSGTTSEKTEEDLQKEFEEFKARRESKE